MAYEKTVWVNGQAPALDADHLNKMEQGIADAVSVTPQSLTDDQKSQARGNINAAPGGFGLGSGAKQISSWDDAKENGWYSGPAPAGIGAGALWGRVDSLSSGYATQTIYSDMYIAAAQRFFIGSAWKPWEWINPFMQLGVEYRTTERYLGKPVYVKAVDFGNAPEGGYKYVDCATNVDKVVDYSLVIWNGAFGQKNIIYDDSGKLLARPYVRLSEGSLSIALAVFEDISTRSVDCLVKYTKTTD